MRRAAVAPVLLRVVGLAAAALFVACASDEQDAPGGPVPRGTPVRIDPEARLSVGVLEGDTVQQFHRVVTPFLLSGGELVVPVAGARAIRVFSPDGGFLRNLGRPGKGPGEFVSLNAAWARGDTIEALDDELMRITRFLPDGSTELVELERVASAQTAVPGAVSDGWLLAGIAEAGMGRRDEMVVHRFARDGAHLGEVARVEGMARYRTPFIFGPDPLSPRALFAVSGGEVYVAETLTPRIRVFGPTGAIPREITWEPDGSLSGEAALGVVVDSAVARAAPGEAAATRRRLEAFPVRDRASAFWDVLVDEEGFIWVRPFEPGRHAEALGGFRGPGPGGRWLILSPEGIRVGSVEVPDELEPVRITSDAVVGIRRDALGVESVRVHSLRRQDAM